MLTGRRELYRKEELAVLINVKSRETATIANVFCVVIRGSISVCAKRYFVTDIAFGSDFAILTVVIINSISVFTAPARRTETLIPSN